MDWGDRVELVQNEQLPVAPPDYHSLFGDGVQPASSGVQPANVELQPGVHRVQIVHPASDSIGSGEQPAASQAQSASRPPPPPYEEPVLGSGVYPATSGGYPAASGGYPATSSCHPATSGVYPTTSGVYPAASGSGSQQAGVFRPVIRLTRVVHVIRRQPADNRLPVTRQPVARQPLSGGQQIVVPPDGKPPNNYMWFSCLVLFLCNPLCGLLAVAYSSVVTDVAKEGKYEEAKQHSMRALTTAALGLVTGIIMWIFIVLFAT